jgi:ferrous iron transport protein B
MDEVERHKIKIDVRMLSKDLGIPVVPVVARYNKGMNELLNIINEIVTGKYVCKPHRIKTNLKELNYAIEKLNRYVIEVFPNISNSRWVALRLLEGDQSIIEAVRSGDLGKIHSLTENKVEIETEV